MQTTPASEPDAAGSGERSLIALLDFGAALVLLVLLGAWEAWLFHLNYRSFLAQAFAGGISYGGPNVVLALAPFVGAYVLALYFFWFSLRSTPRVRWIYFAIFAFACMYEYGYQGAFRRFSSPEEVVMAMLFVDATLYKDTLLGYFNWIALVPIGVYGAVIWRWRRQRRGRAGVVSLVMILCMAAAFYSALFQLWIANPQEPAPTLGLSNFFRTMTFVSWKLARTYHGPRDTIAFHASPPQHDIVFVVDESVRGDHLSLNGYGRPTTPFLDSLRERGLLYSWGAASSATTCSLGSNNLLLSGVTRLPDRDAAIVRQPSIFEYAKAMGYTTYYLDGASSIFWNGTNDDMRYIDHWENAERFAGDQPYDTDKRIAERVRQITTASHGSFIWINKRGTHFHYNNAFPVEQAIWKPIYDRATYDPAMSELLTNSYDNALRYNLGTFFETLLADSSLLDYATILYTSDHGQTLSEHQEPRSHCGESRSEALVPLAMITKQFHPDTAYRASHANLFATLLDIMGFPEAERRYSYAPSLLRPSPGASPSRRYFVGALDGSSPGRYYDFDAP